MYAKTAMPHRGANFFVVFLRDGDNGGPQAEQHIGTDLGECGTGQGQCCPRYNSETQKWADDVYSLPDEAAHVLLFDAVTDGETGEVGVEVAGTFALGSYRLTDLAFAVWLEARLSVRRHLEGSVRDN